MTERQQAYVPLSRKAAWHGVALSKKLIWVLAFLRTIWYNKAYVGSYPMRQNNQ